jgi:hypothetical protein
MTINAQQELNRVAATAAEAVQDFISSRLNSTEPNGSAFTADQLRFYVNNNTVGGVSPSSADRVLRMLRQQGRLDYLVLNRGKSLYRAVPLGTTKA